MPKYGSRRGVWISDQHQELPSSSSSPSLPSFLFQKRPPETKQRVAQRRLGFGCMLHFPHSGRERWGFPCQVSILLPANAPGTGRIAPWRRVCSKVMIVTPPPPPPPPLVHAPRLLPTGALRIDCIKKGSLQGDGDAPQSRLKKSNSELCSRTDKSFLKSPAVGFADKARRGLIGLLQAGFQCVPSVVPSAPHPHAVQTVRATAGLEANKARRNGAPVPCSAAAGCWGQHAKPGADRQGARGLGS